jgi:hypothetical protein
MYCTIASLKELETMPRSLDLATMTRAAAVLSGESFRLYTLMLAMTDETATTTTHAEKLGEIAGVHPDSARRTIRQLEAAGYVRREAHMGPLGTRYRLCVPPSSDEDIHNPRSTDWLLSDLKRGVWTGGKWALAPGTDAGACAGPPASAPGIGVGANADPGPLRPASALPSRALAFSEDRENLSETRENEAAAAARSGAKGSPVRTHTGTHTGARETDRHGDQTGLKADRHGDKSAANGREHTPHASAADRAPRPATDPRPPYGKGVGSGPVARIVERGAALKARRDADASAEAPGADYVGSTPLRRYARSLALPANFTSIQWRTWESMHLAIGGCAMLGAIRDVMRRKPAPTSPAALLVSIVADALDDAAQIAEWHEAGEREWPALQQRQRAKADRRDAGAIDDASPAAIVRGAGWRYVEALDDATLASEWGTCLATLALRPGEARTARVAPRSPRLVESILIPWLARTGAIVLEGIDPASIPVASEHTPDYAALAALRAQNGGRL